MRRIGFALGLMLVCQPAVAQSWVPWHEPSLLSTRPAAKQAASSRSAGSSGQGSGAARAGQVDVFSLLLQQAALSQPDAKPEPQQGPKVLDGGPRPSINPSAPATVAMRTGQSPGTIVIDTSSRRLYLTQSATTALAYPISVGRDGFRWTGKEAISRVANWPDWHPPAEMRERQPGLPEKMTGGLRNPLGAKALYLGNSLYRIHGTNSAQSIGRANSSGCFRMTNSHIIDLASRVGVGTAVVVKSKL